MKKGSKILIAGFLAFGAVSGAAALSETAATEKAVQTTSVYRVPKKAKSVTVDGIKEFEKALETAGETTTIVLKSTLVCEGQATWELDCHGATITFDQPYIKDDGSIDSEAPELSLFKVNIKSTLKLKNAVLIGSKSAAIVFNNAAGELENVTITRANRGLEVNYSKVVLKDCNIVRNVAGNGGGMVVAGNTSKVVMDGCSLSENYSTNLSGGGGAMEIKSGATLYANNTVVVNNYSTEIGGAINCYSGDVYLFNSTLSGNVTSRGGNFGGAIGLNIYGNTFSAVNTVIADNYSDNGGSNRSDIGVYNASSSSTVELIHSIYGAKVGSSSGYNDNSVNVKTDTDSSFGVKYRTDGIRHKDGYSYGIKHPIAASKTPGLPALYVPVKPTGSAASGGVKTYFDYSNIDEVKGGYFDGTEIVPLNGLATPEESAKVTTYFESGTRDGNVIGASSATNAEFYTVTLASGISNGYVHGVSVYGDTYIKGTKVTLKGIANDGYGLGSFTITGDEPINSENNPCELEVNEDCVVSATFAPGYPLAYDANGGSGSIHETLSYADGHTTTVLGQPDSLYKNGYTFTGWNTKADGTGEAKNAGDSVTLDKAVTLYAQWSLKENVAAVIEAIDDIGTVALTDESKAKIDAARALYDALSKEDAVAVSNYEALEAAEAKYASLLKVKELNDLIANLGDVEISDEYESKLDAIRLKYVDLTTEEKALIVGFDEYEAKYESFYRIEEVIQDIDNLGKIKLSDEYDEELEDARGHYEELSEAEKALVSNYEELAFKEYSVKTIKLINGDIASLGELENSDEYSAKVAAIRVAYDTLDEHGQSLVVGFPEFEAKETSLKKIKAVDDLIANLGEIELSDEYDAKIAAIKASYDGLTEQEKALVNGYAEVQKKEADIQTIKQINADIASLGEIENSEDYYEEVAAIRAAYESLDEHGQSLVVGFPEFEAKEASVKTIKEINDLIANLGAIEISDEYDAKIAAIKASYDSLSEQEKALVNGYAEVQKKEADVKKVKDAIALINSIGDVEYNEETKDKIAAAEEAFNALSPEQQKLVSNNEQLTVAKTVYTALEVGARTSLTLTAVLVPVGALIALVVIAYLVLFFLLNKWILVNGKAVRAFKLKEANGTAKLILMNFKTCQRKIEEVYKTKGEATNSSPAKE